MSLNFRAAIFICLMIGLLWLCRPPASARPPQEMLPDESAAKAKQVLQQVIAALGGPAYLNVRDSDCSGHFEDFNNPTGLPFDYTEFRDLWVYPSKNRAEYHTKAQHPHIIGLVFGGMETYGVHGGLNVTVFNGDQGWMLDTTGVSEQSPDQIKNFSDGLKGDMNHVLRLRLSEPGVEAHYAGPDIIDRKEAEWIEFTDRDHRDLRLAVDKFTHLPLRWVIAARDPETREQTEVTITYIQYMTFDGVKAPLNIERYRNDRKVTQTFLSECKFNSGLDPQLFTRASLEQRAGEVRKKGDKNSKTAK